MNDGEGEFAFAEVFAEAFVVSVLDDIKDERCEFGLIGCTEISELSSYLQFLIANSCNHHESGSGYRSS